MVHIYNEAHILGNVNAKRRPLWSSLELCNSQGEIITLQTTKDTLVFEL